MKKRILAILLIFALAITPALAAGTKVNILTKEGPVWLATRKQGEKETLIYSADKGKSWRDTSGYFGDVGFYVKDVRYTGRDYFLTAFHGRGAFTSMDGRTWTYMSDQEWFSDNASYIVNYMPVGEYQVLWTGTEYMMCQDVRGDPRGTHNRRGPNPRNKMVTFLDEGYNILGAMEFDGEVTAIRYKDGAYYATVGGVEHSFSRADWDLGDSMDHVAVSGGYALRQVEENGVTYLDRSYDGYSWVRLKNLPWGERAGIELLSSTGGDFAVRVGEGVYTSPDGLSWTAKTGAEYMDYLNALTPPAKSNLSDVLVHREGDFTATGLSQLVRQEGAALKHSEDGVYWLTCAELAQGVTLNGLWTLKQGVLAEFSDGSGLILSPRRLRSACYDQLPYPQYYVTLNGNYLSFDNPPYEKNSRMMVPLRGVSEALGFTVDHDDKGVTCTKGDTVITVEFGTSNATVNGEAHTLDAGVEVDHDRTYVPIRFFSEQMGLDVTWNGETRTAVLTTK